MTTPPPSQPNDIISPSAVGFAALAVQLAWSIGLLASLRRKAVDLAHAPIEDRIAALLAFAASVMPFEPVPWTTIAAVALGLRHEPRADSAHVEYVRGRARCIERRLKRHHGRALLRFGKAMRASVDAIDADAVLRPRAEARVRTLVRRSVDTLRRIPVQNLSAASLANLRAELADLPDQYIEQCDLAFISAMRQALHLGARASATRS